MDIEKQRLILSALCANRDLMALTAGLLKPSYFDPSLKKTVKFLSDYFNQYKDVPKIQIIRAETGQLLDDVGVISRAETTYISEEIEKFCRDSAVTEAILAGPELLKKGDMGAIIENLKNAITTGLQKDIGIDYFADPTARLEATLQTQSRISTGLPEIDELIGGGLARQELITFLANSGGGKSMNMLNLAHNFLKQGLNGIYITLEMAEGVVTKRLDSMVSAISQADLLKNMHKVAAAVEKAGAKGYGRFFVKRFAENRTNIHTIQAYLQQLEQANGFRPDFIIVDYIDIMGTTHNISLDNLFIKDKYVTEEIRSLGFDYNCIMVSAAQLGRAAIEAEKLNQSHIQGGISKINTSDYVIGIKQDDLMRSQGEIQYDILKSRNSGGVGASVRLGWDPVSLVVSSRAGKKQELKVPGKRQVVIPETPIAIGGQKKGNDVMNLFQTGG
jgi:KaiC/GvpD/RAD55 family RecA-like ATPase